MPDPELLETLRAAAATVRRRVPETPQYAWPLLAQHAGLDVWVKHENHTRIGSFKLRGGAVYMDRLIRAEPGCAGVIAATRGNHGQSIAVNARASGRRAVIVVPEGNNPERTRRWRRREPSSSSMAATSRWRSNTPSDWRPNRGFAWSRRSIRRWWKASRPTRSNCSACRPSRRGLCAHRPGVGDLRSHRRARRAGPRDGRDRRPGRGRAVLRAVVRCRAPVSTNSADTFADGVATRTPVPEAVEAIGRGAARVVTVTDAAILEAQRLLLRLTHNLAEPAGAAALAALLAERRRQAGRRVAVILSGGNADDANLRQLFAAPERAEA